MKAANVRRGIAVALVAVVFIGGACVFVPEHPRHESVQLEGPSRVVVRGAPVLLPEDQVQEGNLVVVGGEARVYGTVRGSLVVVGGGIEVGPHAQVQGDLVTVGNDRRSVAASAKVGGSDVQVELPGVATLIASGLFVWDNLLLVVLTGLAALGLLGWAAWRFVVRRWDDVRFHGTVDARPVRAGLIGCGLHAALGVLGLAALLSGWLAGVGFALWLVAGVAGFVGWILAGVHVGRWLAARRGWRGGAAAHALAGLGVWVLICMIPVAGWLAGMLGSFVGLGAMIAPQDAPPSAAVSAPALEPLPAPSV